MSDLQVGQVIQLRQYADSPVVQREIISIEGEQVYYRKSERDAQGHQRIGQCSRKLLLSAIEKYGLSAPAGMINKGGYDETNLK
ncbi:hypothetical protein LJR153_005058 [Paenibacillus sp. LjRoot153]|uniref:hypothetical protein n=1 Tax=Paenibacillus sp. LjRoot153 TaxID=3342270 RepID=UPI003ECF6044